MVRCASSPHFGVSFFARLTLALVLGACSQQAEKTSTVRIKLPTTKAVYKASHFGKVMAANTNGSWGVASPADFDEIACFGVLVGGPEDRLQRQVCKNASGEVVFRAGIIKMAYPAGSEFTMNVPVGPERRFALVGFAATSLEACTGVDGVLRFGDLSAPSILAQVRQDIDPGVAEISFKVKQDLSNAIEFDKCASPEFGLDPAQPSIPPPLLSISDGPVFDFGPVISGQTVSHTFFVSNNGSFNISDLQAAELSAPFSFAGGSFPGAGGDCSAILAAGQSCRITVDFSPVVVSSESETLTLNFANERGEPLIFTRSLRGQGVTPALLTLSESDPFEFGIREMGTTTVQTFYLSNSGGYKASGLTSSLPGADPWLTLSGGDCGAELLPGEQCRIIVSFSPTGASRSASEILQVNYHDGMSVTSSSRSLAGTGRQAAVLSITPAGTYDFGDVAATGSDQATFTIQNLSDVSHAVNLSETGLAAPFSIQGGWPGTGGSCGTTIPANSQCSIVVTFDPPAVQSYTANIVLNFESGFGVREAVRAIRGRGAAPALLSISNGPTFSFGSVALNGSSTASLTITNSGGVAATGVGFSGLTPPFAVVGDTCGSSIAAGGTCQVSVEFSPTLTGLANGALEVTYNNGVIIANATRDLSGEGAATLADLTISSASYDFVQVPVGGDAYHNLLVSNPTTTPATGIAATINPMGPFSIDGSTCNDLANGENCIITVKYKPTMTGGDTATLEITYINDGVSNTVTETVSYLGTGVIPVTGTWMVSNTASAPDPRSEFSMTAVNDKFIVWGGKDALGGPMADGAAFDPIANTWTALGTTGTAPSPRFGHSANWNGKELFIVGGYNGSAYQSTVHAYNPASDEWRIVAELPATRHRANHGAVWAGSHLYVFGGDNGSGTHASGHLKYDPVNNQWTELSTSNAPSARSFPAVVWTGREILVYGGVTNNNPQGNGSRYNPRMASWAPMTTSGAPPPRRDFAYAWTGTHLLIFGGYSSTPSPSWYNDLWAYDPVANQWQQLAAGAPGTLSPRNHAKAVWTGTHFVIFGGFDGINKLEDGAMFSPAKGLWENLHWIDRPSSRIRHEMAFNGSQIFVFGGLDTASATNSGGILKPTAHFPHLRQLATQYDHNCALDNNGYVVCWGANSAGELGNGANNVIGDDEDISVAPAVDFAGQAALQVATADQSTCAILDDFSARCWGLNANGQLGNGTTTNSNTAVAVSGSLKFTKIAAGADHYCAITTDSRVACWGSNSNGQLGDNSTTDRLAPVYVRNSDNLSDLVGIREIAAGLAHSCALDEQGKVLCWGRGNQGQLGYGSATSSLLPVKINDFGAGAGALVASGDVTCATHGGQLKCWGYDIYGNIGDGTAGGSQLSPFIVSLFGMASDVLSVGPTRTCANNSLGLYCWGDNSSGGLGLDSTTPTFSPALLPPAIGDHVRQVSVGREHTCALYQNDSLKCWGGNSLGQLGLGNTTNVGDSPGSSVGSLGEISF